MRTTLTLDPDVAARLKAEVRRTGRSFKDVVNEHLRTALILKRRREPGRFIVKPRDMGSFPGLNYDNIGELLEKVAGPLHR